MSLDYQIIEAALLEKYYVNIPINLSGMQINDAVQAFFKFLDEPAAIKNHINFNIAPRHRRGLLGYQQRDPSGHIYNDSKEFFHYHPALLKHYSSFIKANAILNNFIQQAQPIWQIVYDLIHGILQTFEPHYPGALKKVFDGENPHIILRFLKYDWNESGEYLAKPHFDAGACTLAIAESCSGLRIGSNPENLKPVKHEKENAVFMLSSNFEKIIPDTKFSAGWHDVIQTNRLFIGLPCSRWAIVAFIDALNVEALPRSITHKWYSQESEEEE